MSEKTIYELWGEIQAHPDFAGGAIFTRDDVAEALNDDVLDGDEPTPEMIAAVTDQQMSEAIGTIDSYIFNGSYSWREAIRDCVSTDA